MWPWIRRWLDWVTTDVLPLPRTRPHGQAVHTRYEKAGLTLHDLPVPWNADAVVVEVLLRVPVAARRKADFTLRLPGREPISPESLRPDAAHTFVAAQCKGLVASCVLRSPTPLTPVADLGLKAVFRNERTAAAYE